MTPCAITSQLPKDFIHRWPGTEAGCQLVQELAGGAGREARDHTRHTNDGSHSELPPFEGWGMRCSGSTAPDAQVSPVEGEDQMRRGFVPGGAALNSTRLRTGGRGPAGSEAPVATPSVATRAGGTQHGGTTTDW